LGKRRKASKSEKRKVFEITSIREEGEETYRATSSAAGSAAHGKKQDNADHERKGIQLRQSSSELKKVEGGFLGCRVWSLTQVCLVWGGAGQG